VNDRLSSTIEDLIQRIEALAPTLAARASETEQRRAPLPETVAAFRAAGLLRVFVPRRYGGLALGWRAPYVLGRAIARHCPSSTWLVSIVGPHAAYTGRFPVAAQDEVWAEGPDIVIAAATVSRGGRLTRDRDGVRVAGHFGFASAVDHASWALIIGATESGEAISCLLPRRDFSIEDDWYAAGLRGTGTKTIVADAWVPAHRIVSSRILIGPRPPGSVQNPEPMYAREYTPFVAGVLLGPMLGATEAGIDAYVTTTRARVGALFGNRPAEMTTVQERLAESTAEFRAAELLADAVMNHLLAREADGGSISPERQLEFGRDRSFAMKLCTGAMQRLTQQMGALGLFDDNPVQRFARDVAAMATHFGVGWDRNMVAFGRALLNPGDVQEHPFWKT